MSGTATTVVREARAYGGGRANGEGRGAAGEPVVLGDVLPEVLLALAGRAAQRLPLRRGAAA
jgi:hypothetical protein